MNFQTKKVALKTFQKSREGLGVGAQLPIVPSCFRQCCITLSLLSSNLSASGKTGGTILNLTEKILLVIYILVK